MASYAGAPAVGLAFTKTRANTLCAITSANITASKPEIIARARAELTKQEADRRLHMHGKIAEGNEGNLNWSWHFVDDEWDLAREALNYAMDRRRMLRISPTIGSTQ